MFVQSFSWLVWFLASFFYAYQYVLRVLPSIILPDLIEKFHIDTTQMGQFSGFYYLGYAGMHIPLGLMLDRIGPKWVLPGCILLCVLGLSPLVFSDTWVYPSLGRLFIGMGSSGAILGVFKIIRLQFKEEHFNRILGFSVTIGLLGAIYGGQPVRSLLIHMGWDMILLGMMIIGLGLAALLWVLIPAQKHDNLRGSGNIWSDIKAVLFNQKILWVCCLGGLMVGPLEGFADVWGLEFLKRIYGMDGADAATLTSFIFLGMCFGAPILTYFADKTQAYTACIVISGIGMGLSFLVLLFGLGNFMMLSVLFWVVGILCAYQILVIYKATTYVDSHLVGLSTSIANMIIMIFGYVFHSLIGVTLDVMSGQSAGGDVNHYGSNAFIVAIGLVPLGLLFGVYGFSGILRREKRR